MKKTHILERLGHDLDRIGMGIIIGRVICVLSHPAGEVWPWLLGGGLIAVGGLLELRGWQLRKQTD
jgi:hypothetical protein